MGMEAQGLQPAYVPKHHQLGTQFSWHAQSALPLLGEVHRLFEFFGEQLLASFVECSLLVLSYSNSSINIPGKHQIHTHLGYYPAFPHGITVTTNGHLLVAQYSPPAIHIYNIQGDELATISHTKLGLDEELAILGIRCASNHLLHVAGGVFEEKEEEMCDTIQSLHAYEVS